MKIIFLIMSLTLFISNIFGQVDSVDVPRIKTDVKFLNSVDISAKEYILKQFEKYNTEILIERYHAEKTQYTLINEVINDDYFVSNVGNICIEIGAENFSDSLNFYLKNNDDDLNIGESKLLDFQRNISWNPLWTHNSYHLFLKNLFLLNKSLKHSQRINLYLTDTPIEWRNINNEPKYWKARRKNREYYG